MSEHVLLRTVEPATEPLDLGDAKAHLRVDLDDEDAWIQDQIQAAREEAERETVRALITQTWELSMPAFPSGREPIELRRPPIQSVTSIAYTDGDGDPQTVDDFVLKKSEPGKLYPANGASWPTGVQSDNPVAVTVTFVAGYGDWPESIPYPLRAAMLLRIEDHYSHRGNLVTGTIVNRLRAVESTYLLYAWDLVLA